MTAFEGVDIEIQTDANGDCHMVPLKGDALLARVMRVVPGARTGDIILSDDGLSIRWRNANLLREQRARSLKQDPATIEIQTNANGDCHVLSLEGDGLLAHVMRCIPNAQQGDIVLSDDGRSIRWRNADLLREHTANRWNQDPATIDIEIDAEGNCHLAPLKGDALLARVMRCIPNAQQGDIVLSDDGQHARFVSPDAARQTQVKKYNGIYPGGNFTIDDVIVHRDKKGALKTELSEAALARYRQIQVFPSEILAAGRGPAPTVRSWIKDVKCLLRGMENRRVNPTRVCYRRCPACGGVISRASRRAYLKRHLQKCGLPEDTPTEKMSSETAYAEAASMLARLMNVGQVATRRAGACAAAPAVNLRCTYRVLC